MNTADLLAEKREPGEEVVIYLVLNVFIKLYEKASCEILIFPTEILKNRAGNLPDMNRPTQLPLVKHACVSIALKKHRNNQYNNILVHFCIFIYQNRFLENI